MSIAVTTAEDDRAAKLERRLLRHMSTLNRRFNLIEPDDKIMVAISGGKDSWALLHLLRAYERMLPFSFELVAVNLDQGHPGFPVSVLREHLEAHGFAHRLVARDTHTVVKANTKAGKAFCSLCSRLRRGILYDVAVELGATKIALGHHRDDVIETLLLNAFYAGQLKAMPAKLYSDDGRNVVIRPLASCGEAEIAAWAQLRGFPIVPCDLCGSQPNLKRQQIKGLLATLEQDNPLLRKNLLAAVGNVKPSHLWDPDLGHEAEAEDEDEGEQAPPHPSLGLTQLRIK
ncbi:tRNA(Cytosine32)-2-thiocytidine synthetase [Enhygromyxa salina]|uniref:tRNA(Cytosine32)-2-thiocytidine synthetase n=1 Tax=Enhygromyxa salina TaxID=215803 RepID=A0A0C1ZJ02_9BACT|nr:tRNA 2-thiocytidine(32) synthetase TtcA [Enhygromyxa salina]KIG17509.1 tRNA(Cytosine32)-2-thiocytidine synthetase [Enhygromyxa salina]